MNKDKMLGNKVPFRGPGGRGCTCCGEAPHQRTRVRRNVKRSERQAVRKFLSTF